MIVINNNDCNYGNYNMIVTNCSSTTFIKLIIIIINKAILLNKEFSI